MHMTEPTAVPPPLPSVSTKPKAKRWKFVIAALAGGFLLLRLLASINTVELEVRRIDLFHDGKVLEITNLGKKPINVTGITANDRDDCKLKKLVFIQGQDDSYPIPLKVGESERFSGNCRLVRATIETDQGSNTYGFNR
jgi:hypothetical protein